MIRSAIDSEIGDSLTVVGAATTVRRAVVDLVVVVVDAVIVTECHKPKTDSL